MAEERKRPLDQEGLDDYVKSALGRVPIKKRKRPRYPSEVQRQKATYSIPRELHQGIREIAKDLEVPVSDVARAFLEFGLRQYHSGELELEVGPDYERRRIIL